MASITDELREWANTFWGCGGKSHYAGDLLAIADRIDAEHEKAVRELNDYASDSVLLPRDADDEVIRVGDMMEHCKTHGHVIALMLSNYPNKWGGGLHWAIQLEGEHTPTALDLTFHHYHEPTEDVLREFVSEFNRDDTELCDEEIIERFAKKLRLAGDA